MTLINTRILSHPLNWAIVILMLVIAGMGGHLLLTFFEQEPARGDQQLPQGLSTQQLEPDMPFVSQMPGFSS